MIPPRFTTADYRVGLAIALYVLLLGALPLLVPVPAFRWLFSEAGPFERLSAAAWLFIAVLVIVRIRPLGFRACAFALICAFFAAREADLHRFFTADSVLKINYYRRSVAPIEEKFLAGAVAAGLIALLIYAGLVIFRFLIRQGGWRSRSGFWLAVGALLLIVGKMFDRAPATLANSGIVVPPLLVLYSSALEEGLETITPLVLGWSVWISAKERPALFYSGSGES